MAEFVSSFLCDSPSIILTLLTVTEPFIVPALYEAYIGKVAGIDVVDEWTLSLAMGSDLATRMEQHYKTFIVRFLSL